jgi:hypothetical protein
LLARRAVGFCIVLSGAVVLTANLAGIPGDSAMASKMQGASQPVSHHP